MCGGGDSLKTAKNVEILWVDDEVAEHGEDARNMESVRKELKVTIVHPGNLQSTLGTLKKMPDLFLVDYFLDELEGDNNRKYEQRGLAVAGKIRELEPEWPVYVVTNKGNKKEGILFSEAQAAIASFDKILTFKEVQREGHDILYYDALDYRSIRDAPRRDPKAIFKLLEAPDNIKDRLRLVLPNELREGLSPSRALKYPEGDAISFAKWVRLVLLSIPGFLYDELHAATYLGMKADFFRRIYSKLKRAKYSGIFSRTNPSLWWVSKLNDILFSSAKAQKSDRTNPWEVGPIVFGLTDAQQAKCVVCNKSFPETIGIDLKDDKNLKPVHYRCSIPHPAKKRELYFDEPRAFELKDHS